MLDFRLTPEQEELREKARRFAREEVLLVAAYYDAIDEPPLPVIQKAYEAGIINLDIPKQYGGQGLGLLEATLVVEEIAAACAGTATSLFDNSLGMEPLLLSDNEALKEKYLPRWPMNSKRSVLPPPSPPWDRTSPVFAAGPRKMATTIFSTAPNTGSPTAAWPTTHRCSQPLIPKPNTKASAPSWWRWTGPG
jgi:hypothetical protein